MKALGILLGLALVIAVSAVALRRPPPSPAKPILQSETLPALNSGMQVETRNLEQPEAEERPRPKRAFDLKELKLAVREGDWFRMISVGGDLPPESAEKIFSLISELPATLNETDRNEMVRRLMDILRRMPGEESTRYILLAAMKDGLLPFVDWMFAIHELGRRRAPGAIPYLESVAFSTRDFETRDDAGTRACTAMGALLKVDADRYLPAVIEGVRGSTGLNFNVYVGVLSSLDENARPEIGDLIPFLQERYRAMTGQEFFARYSILGVVVDYAAGSKSATLREWAAGELAKREFKEQDGLKEDWGDVLYDVLAKQLEDSAQ